MHEDIGIDEYIARSPRLQRKVAEEELIQDAVEAIWKEMEIKKISKSDLAVKLEVTPANVTQALRGSRNLTLRSLAAFAFVLGKAVKIALVPKEVAYSTRWQVVNEPPVDIGLWTYPGDAGVIVAQPRKAHSAKNDASYGWHIINQQRAVSGR